MGQHADHARSRTDAASSTASATADGRLLPLQGGINFRDLGGYPTADGHRVRWNRLFRSGVLDALTDADYAYLQRIDIAVICDFRDNHERAQAPTQAPRIATAGRYLCWDYLQTMDSRGFAEALAAGADAATEASAMMTRFYRQLPQAFAPRYRETFAALKEGGGLLFHCSAGKDRTGLMAALLLTALGVDEATVLADYALTDRVPSVQKVLVRYAATKHEDPAMAMFAQLPADAIKALMASDPTYLRTALAQIRDDHGSLHGYLRDALGIDDADREALGLLYLEPINGSGASSAL